MIVSVFFIVSYLALLTGCLAVKKNDRKESFITWTVIAFMFTLCYQTAAAAFFWKTGIPVSILTVGIADVKAEGGVAEPVSYVSADGSTNNSLQPGVNIVKYSDGTVRKIIK